MIIPANEEATHIGSCLKAVAASDGPETAQIVVVANGCDDDTAEIARGFTAEFATRGWKLDVLELPAGGKMAALNAGDAVAQHAMRAYLDADVIVTPALLGQITDALSTDAPRYASGRLQLAPAASWVTRAYGRIYAGVPFVRHGVPGAGLFATNKAGRARWALFPEIISDDTFVRLSFSAKERIGVAASYDWPLVEGFGQLIKVRRRQNAGVAQVVQKYPELMANDDKMPMTLSAKLKLAAGDPVGFLVYAGVSIIVKFTPQHSATWGRGR